MSRPVALLHLITQLPVGGAQENTLLTVQGLDRGRYRVDLASSPGGAWFPWAAQVADQLHLLPGMKREMALWEDGQTVRDLVRLLRREKYDIVHTHSSKAGFLGRVAARLARTPVVIHTVHGFAFHDQTFSPRRRAMYLWLERIGARLCDHLVLVAALNRQEALARGIGRPNAASVIYSGIDLRRFDQLPDKAAARRRLGLSPTAPVVGFVGRLSAATAPLLFVAAAHRLLARYPDLQVLLVGDGELRAPVAAAVGRAPRLHCLGYRRDVPDLLAAMDVFISSNLWGGLGRAITEAAAAGRPVVAFPVNGVPELIAHEVAGLHARTGDADDLADKAAWLLERPAWAAQLGAAGRARAYADFGAEQMVAALDALYQRLLQQRGVVV